MKQPWPIFLLFPFLMLFLLLNLFGVGEPADSTGADAPKAGWEAAKFDPIEPMLPVEKLPANPVWPLAGVPTSAVEP